ncbi:MAG: biotin/lipoyl-containing protein [Bdellovibrionota bacterium]
MLETPEFVEGSHTTSWIEHHLEDFVVFRKNHTPLIASVLGEIERDQNHRDQFPGPWNVLQDPQTQSSLDEWNVWGDNISPRFDSAQKSSIDFQYHKDRNSLWIHVDGQTFWVRKNELKYSSSQHENQLSFSSPITGKICQLFVSEGDNVENEQDLAEIEAMKMRYTIRSKGPSRVKKLFVRVGEVVEEGRPLGTLESR